MNPVLDTEGLARYHQLLKSKELGTKANKSAGVFYIEGSGDEVGIWLGSHPEISEYYSGLMIAYKVGIAGASDGSTLNINGLGAVKVVRNATSAVTTTYGVNTIVFLVYTVDSDGTAYWKIADYDSDTKTRSSNKTGSKMYIIGATSQSTSGQTTYSNSNCYIGTDNCLYSGGKKVMNSSDTAAKASQLATARTIALTGDATGSAKFDGSGDVTLDVTVSGGGATGDSLNGNVITAALPISAGDIVAFGMHIVDIDTEDVIYGYMPLGQCHLIVFTHPFLGADADIAQGETSENVSLAGKYPVASIKNMSLEVGEPVFLRCAPGLECLTVKGYTAMFDIYSQIMPEAFEGVTYDGPDALTQWKLSEYNTFEKDFVDPANLYILLGHAISESEIMLCPSHPAYLDTGNSFYLYADSAMFDDMGRVISTTYATKAEVGGNYVLPAATSTTLGGVKIGSNITNSSGTISVSKTNVTNALGYTPLQSYTLPTASSSTMGGVKIGSNISVSSGTISLSKSNVTGALGYTPLQTAPVTSVNGSTGAITGLATTAYVQTAVGSKISASGSRGSLAGYETNGTSTTINESASDSNQTGSAITVSNGSSGTSWTKIVRVTAAVSVTLGSSWKWQGGAAPTIVSGGVLVCCWCGSGGIATFVSPS